jgi:hypothetical protein
MNLFIDDFGLVILNQIVVVSSYVRNPDAMNRRGKRDLVDERSPFRSIGPDGKYIQSPQRYRHGFISTEIGIVSFSVDPDYISLDIKLNFVCLFQQL